MSDGSITATESEIPLADCIVASYVRSKISTDREQKYLPEGSVERLITPFSIREELSDIPIEPELLDNLISFIVTRAKKVFTITILSQLSGLDLYNAIKTFQDVGFDDDKLPVLPDRHADLMSAAFKGRRLWNAVRKEGFLTDQWGLLVPVFTRPQLMHSLQESAILPLERVSSAFKGGTFGDVYEATVHRAHMDDELFKVRPVLLVAPLLLTRLAAKWFSYQYCGQRDQSQSTVARRCPKSLRHRGSGTREKQQS